MMDIFRINNLCQERLDAERIRTMLLIAEIIPADNLYEVGSTAIEGVIGKQDIDFLVRVPETEFETSRTALDSLFTRNPDQLSSRLFQGYTVNSDIDISIQLTTEGGPYDTFLTFSNQLRNSKVLRDEYNTLKLEFDGHPMSEYRDAKHVFVERVLALITDE